MERVIAMDGPSGAGKSSVSRRVGELLGFWHVDSGALYRIVTWQALAQGVDTGDEGAVAELANRLEVAFEPRQGRIAFLVDGVEPEGELRSVEVNAHASPVAKVKAVRDRVTQWLQSLVRYGDLIVEGRDITTAVFPESPARFYLDADPEVRAQRRHLEEATKGIAKQSVEAVKASLLARDKIDSTRQHAPLRLADGVIRIDSTNLTFDQVVDTVLHHLPPTWQWPKIKPSTNP